jgi:SAM-dependent methyltransferase
MVQKEMNDIYSKTPPDEIPWNIKTPPKVLVDLVESGDVPPCKTLDLGCGAGNYAIYLAGMGFDVTGIDVSSAAIKMAVENARNAGVDCRFMQGDILGDMSALADTFDFIYDWALLHHIFPEHRGKFVDFVHGRLKEQGRYLSLCFSENDPQFGGKGKYRNTLMGTQLYFSSEEEMQQLFEPLFRIDELTTISISGKYAPHQAVCALMVKK